MSNGWFLVAIGVWVAALLLLMFLIVRRVRRLGGRIERKGLTVTVTIGELLEEKNGRD